jgi:hypothetical protein
VTAEVLWSARHTAIAKAPCQEEPSEIMKEEEFRKYQISRDERSLDDKIERWKQIQPVTYGQQLPRLMWEYMTAADEMFIDGHFLGVILLSAAITELVLSDQLMAVAPLTSAEIERFGLEQMTILSRRLQILTDQERDAIDELRRLRNALIHANAGKLGRMARKSYGGSYEGLGTEFYLFPFSEESGICADSLRYLCFTRNLTFRFYGAQPPT